MPLAIALQIACAGGAPPRPNAQLRPGALAGANVLLITIDTLRADRVGAYGGGALTPALDRLAGAGVRFARAWAHAPLTLPAHTSILTGLVPPTHGVHANGAAGVAPAVPTLATILHDAGYRTGAFVGAFVLDARFGLSRGFDTYDDRVGADTGPTTFAFAERTADRVVQLAGDWILEQGSATARPREPETSPGAATEGDARALRREDAGGREPSAAAERERAKRPVPGVGPQRREETRGPATSGKWFCWVHLFDPHAPYRAPEQRASNPYDNEVAFADAQIGRLLDRLRASGQLDRTLIVVLADHGESLGEHGEATHGLFAYDATLHIPLIVAGPSIHAQVIGEPAGQADVMPTVLDLIGVTPPSPLDGRSLVAAVRGDAVPERPIYFEALDAYLTRNWAPLTGLVAGGWKYIDLPEAELYDLAHDPGERRNRIGDEPQRAAALRTRLAAWPAASTALAHERQAPLDPEAAARLRSLGYAAAPPRAGARTRFGVADDPKRLIDLDRRFERALTLTGDRQYAEAAALLRSVLAARPDFTLASTTLAAVLVQRGEPREAVMLLEDATRSGIAAPEIPARLGAAYLAEGDPARAVAVLDPLVARGEGGLDAVNTLAVALSQLGRRDRARALFAQLLDRSPGSATTWTNLGLLELQARRPDRAAGAFERATDADPRLAQAWEGLGAARVRADPSGAIDAWRRAIALDPRNYDLLFNLAALLHEQGRREEARPYIERFVREAPPDRYARDRATVRAWLGR